MQRHWRLQREIKGGVDTLVRIRAATFVQRRWRGHRTRADLAFGKAIRHSARRHRDVMRRSAAEAENSSG